MFEAQTKGWVKKESIVPTKGTVTTATSPDGTYSISYRTFSSDSAQPPFTKINATIDVQEYKIFSNGYRDKIGKLTEVKFAE